MLIRTQAFPRAGLVGNPSDGYHGKTVSFVIRNFAAHVTLWESPELEILPNARDHSSFGSIRDLVLDVRQHGYYGGVRLLKATIKRFHDYCVEKGLPLDDRNFTVRYSSDIPSQVGLAGSSAIITACLRALMQFYEVRIPPVEQPDLILSVETRELGIPAGLQDRVIQVYEGLVFMDFDRDYSAHHGHGRYEPLDPALLPPLYIAYRTDLAEGTEVFHNDIRNRYQRGERAVVEAMQYWAELTESVRGLLLAGRGVEIGPLLDRNFNKRCDIYRISRRNRDMVEAARSVGASAKFTGSGGAIVGTYTDAAMFQALEGRLEPLGIQVFKPVIQ
ncbi:MAG: GHMP kinase [Verrucomicrobiales bacterium]|nr:GHMP kinase [Planctomycetota bacterium]MCP5524688.1 GHMP kinase [Verrucomicrobiales bacterium]